MGQSFVAFLKSFVYALRGIGHCIVHERNMRFHLVAAGYTLYFSTFYDFDRGEFLLLLGVIVLVMVCEAVNTSVEATVNLYTREYRENARIAKDAAAGAVLLSAIFAVAVGVLLFWEPTVIAGIWEYFIATPLRWAVFLAVFAAAVIFVFLPNRIYSGERRKKRV